MSIDLSKATTGTDLATTLGFSQANSILNAGVGYPGFNPIGVFVSDIEVRFDAQGTKCVFESSLITSRRVNNAFRRVLAIVPFAGKTSASDNVWPSGGLISPAMVYEGSRSVQSLDIQIKTSDGRPMLFMSGGVDVVIGFIY